MNTNANNSNQSVGAAIGRVAIDMLKITVAVAGGIAVYKLAENYLGGDNSGCCGGGAVPALDTAAGMTSGEAAAFCAAERIDSVF
jgi:hypothetical protein